MLSPKALLYLSAFFEQYRDDYFDLLLATSQNGDLCPFHIRHVGDLIDANPVGFQV